MGSPITRVAFAAALCAASLAACDRASMQNADRTGAAVGRKANDALQRGESELAVAGRNAQASLEKAGKEIRRTLSGAEEKSEPAGSAPAGSGDGSALADAAITASIKTDFLKDPDLSVLKIDVDTRDGVVTLNGLAANDAARQRAGRIAQGIKGVKEVRNYLVLKRG